MCVFNANVLEFHECVRLDIRYARLIQYFAEVGARMMIILLSTMVMIAKMTKICHLDGEDGKDGEDQKEEGAGSCADSDSDHDW